MTRKNDRVRASEICNLDTSCCDDVGGLHLGDVEILGRPSVSTHGEGLHCSPCKEVEFGSPCLASDVSWLVAAVHRTVRTTADFDVMFSGDWDGASRYLANFVGDPPVLVADDSSTVLADTNSGVGEGESSAGDASSV